LAASPVVPDGELLVVGEEGDPPEDPIILASFFSDSSLKLIVSPAIIFTLKSAYINTVNYIYRNKI
jgi:hypothetical protein